MPAPPAAQYTLVAEGPLPTARLRVHHLHTRPLAAHTPPVLLLGGSNADLRLKRGFLATALCATHELVTYEPRGIGRTQQPPGIWTLTDYAADALAVLDALGWDRALVLGESFGGMTALHLAARAPDRVIGLAIASTVAGGVGGGSVDISPFLALSRSEAAHASMVLQDTAMGELEAAQPHIFEQKHAERVQFETAFTTPSITSGGYARLLAARRGHDVWDRLEAITLPTTVIIGARDGQAPPATQLKMARRLPQAHVRLYDAGHGLLFTIPQVIAALLRDWANVTTAAN
mgnify:CR=1 FL=1